MLTPIQQQQINQFHLHNLLVQKGIVMDNEIIQALGYWRQILINEANENQRLKDIETQATGLHQERNKLAVDVFNLLNEKNDFNRRILHYKSKEQELKRKIAELTKLIEKEKILTNSYREQKNEILQQSQQDQTNFLNNLRGKQNKINNLETDLDLDDELLAKKNQKITALYQEISQLKSENNKCLSELNELDADFRQQEQLLADKNTKLAKVIQERDDLKIQLTAEKQAHQQTQNQVQQKEQEFINNQTTINDLTKQLTEKDKLIQKQSQRIKELEHKPPVVKTENKEIQETRVETEYPIETIVEVENKAQSKEIIRLKQTIEYLKQQLSQKLVPSQITVRKNLPETPKMRAIFQRERVLIYSFLGIILVLVGIILLLGKKLKGKRLYG